MGAHRTIPAVYLRWDANGKLSLSSQGANQALELLPSGTASVAVCDPASTVRQVALSAANGYGVIQSVEQGVALRPLRINPNGGNVLLGTVVDSGALLQLGTNTVTSAGGKVFGTDTFLYRVAAGRLALDHAGGNTPVLFFRESGVNTGQIDTTSGVMELSAIAGAMKLYSNGTLALTLDASQEALFAGYIRSAGASRVTAQFDKTADTALANVTGLSAAVAAAGVYQFEAVVFETCAAAGGSKVAVGGTCTATNISYSATVSIAGNSALTGGATALGTAVAGSTAANTRHHIVGLITVNAAGTLTVQFAQNAASGTSSVLVGSYLLVTRVA